MTTLDQALPLVQEPKLMSLEERRTTLRERLQRRFEVWLDEALDPEAVPQGLAAEILAQLEAETPEDASNPTGDQDLQAMCATLVGLTETARHQGVAFEQFHKNLPPVQTLAEAVSSLMTNLAADRKSQAQERQQQEKKLSLEARRQIFQEVLGTVIDMRNHLCHGLTEAQAQLDTIAQAAVSAPQKRWWQTSSKTQPSLEASLEHTGLEALVKANRLALGNIDQTLTQWHVKLIEGVGQPVNGKTMKIVGQVIKPDVAEGTVVKVLRVGYMWNGILCRPAEVCVVQLPVSH
jgi:molecular chaperone GrpE (heat shock protein)